MYTEYEVIPSMLGNYTMDRRRLLALPLVPALLGQSNPGILELPPPPADARVPYGDDPLQFGDLRLPKGRGPHPVAIVIHGGFWKAAYSLEHIGHLCAALTRAGFTTWSLEYRRIGNPGGGWPGTFEDVSRGAKHVQLLAAKHPLDLKRMISIGHSAGGHLALWLASEKGIPLRGAISLAGVADLKRAWELRLSNKIVAQLLGGSPEEVPDRYRLASPIERLPLGVPQRLLHGTRDDIVPFEISERYQRAAKAAGDDAQLTAFEGVGHFELIDPRAAEWGRIERIAVALVTPPRADPGA